MNHVARQQDTDDERHDRRDIGNACSHDGAKLLNDEIVDERKPDLSRTTSDQPPDRSKRAPISNLVSRAIKQANRVY
jgi:hypothetical protein